MHISDKWSNMSYWDKLLPLYGEVKITESTLIGIVFQIKDDGKER